MNVYKFLMRKKTPNLCYFKIFQKTFSVKRNPKITY